MLKTIFNRFETIVWSPIFGVP
ncbi:hypothetical protein BGLA2_690018 [Burkholderia gladioli]|nr:hypothetical protein BGLA2_690018 [Burkholderia gladioli]